MKKTTITTVLLLFIGLFISQSAMAQIVDRTNNSINPNLVPTESVGINIDAITPTTIDVTFTPIPECSAYTFVVTKTGEMQMWMNMMGQTMSALIQSWGITKSGVYTHNYTGMQAGTLYTIFVLPKDGAGNEMPIDSLQCTTPTGGGTGIATQQIEVKDITSTTARVIVTPNDQTSVFHDGLIDLNYFNQIGADSAIKLIQSNGYPQYAIDNWLWQDLKPNTTYKVIAIGKNANDEWGPATYDEFTTMSVSVKNLTSSSFDIFPNPNNGNFTLDTKSNITLKEIKIMNTQGKVIRTKSINNEMKDISIDMPNGIYFIQVVSSDDKIVETKKIIISK